MKACGSAPAVVAAALLYACAASAAGAPGSVAAAASPQAGARTHAQNYKDMVLATCIANAYRGDRAAAVDAGSSVSALRDWTVYDMERAPDEIKALVDAYLARDYRNPLADAEIKGVRFDLLKCLDLYHSQELQAQTRSLVIQPRRTYRQGAAQREQGR